MCEDTCDVCELSFEGGPGSGCFPQQVYWFNPDTGACEEKTYEGCDGNENRFDTLAACVDACHPERDDAGAGCLVDGLLYADGERVEDPFSCNSCECQEGRLDGCTEIACALDCPPDTVEGSACALCSADGGCDVVETACLPECSDDDDCSGPRPFCDVAAGHCAAEPDCE